VKAPRPVVHQRSWASVARATPATTTAVTATTAAVTATTITAAATVATAAVAAATTVAATTTTAAEAATAATTAAAAAALTLTRFVHAQLAALHVVAVQAGDGRLGVGLGHLDETEAAETACLAIVDEAHGFDGAVL
jgi:ribonuclease D